MRAWRDPLNHVFFKCNFEKVEKAQEDRHHHSEHEPQSTPASEFADTDDSSSKRGVDTVDVLKARETRATKDAGVQKSGFPMATKDTKVKPGVWPE